MDGKRSISNGLLISIGLLMLIPFALLFVYVHPQSDDYFFASQVAEFGIFGFVKQMYLFWTARYSSMFIGAFNPWVFGSVWAYQLSLFGFFSLLLVANYQLINSLLGSQLPKIKTVIISLLTTFWILQTSPDIYENLYWFPSVSTYQLSISLYLLLVSRIILLTKDEITVSRFLLFCIPLLILLAGLLEVMIPIIGLTFLFFLWLIPSVSKSQKQALWISLAVFSVFGLVTLIGPGNYERLSKHILPLSAFQILTYSLKSTALLSFHFMQMASFVFGLILLFLGFKTLSVPTLVLRKIHPIPLAIASLAIIWLLFIPVVYALNGIPPGRVFNLIAFIGLGLTTYNIYNLTLYLSNKYPHPLELPSWIFTMIVVGLFVISLFGTYISDVHKFVNADKNQRSEFVVNPSNYSAVVYSLLFDAKDVFNGFKNFERQLSQAHQKGKRTCQLEPIAQGRKLLLLRNPLEYEGKWHQFFESTYYSLDSIYIIPKNQQTQNPN